MSIDKRIVCDQLLISLFVYAHATLQISVKQSLCIFIYETCVILLIVIRLLVLVKRIASPCMRGPWARLS